MKNIFLSTLVFLTSFWALAQRDLAFVNQQVDAFSKELAIEGVQNWMWTMRYCDGGTQMFRMPDGSNCFSKGTYYALYLFYPNGEDKMKVKKFDNCGSFYPIDLSDNSILTTMSSSWAELEKEEVKPYRAETRSTSPEQRTAIHNCRRQLQFKNKDQRLDKLYNLFDLVEEGNLSYQSNSNLNLIKLDDQMGQLIDQLESNLKREMKN